VTAKDKAEGYSVFGSYQFNPQWGAFARYDYSEPNKTTNADYSDNYYNVGIAYSPAKIVDFGLVWKHDEKDNPSATVNGETTDEIGVFSQFRF
jgi:predicted porin